MADESLRASFSAEQTSNLPPLVLLDANVLVPASLRDTLLRAAEDDLYRPCWSQQIWDEVVRAVVARGMMAHERALRLVQHATAAFPFSSVSGYEGLIPNLACDPSDRHVLAAAVHARAVQIVTANIRHFSSTALEPYGITAVLPDAFLVSLLDVHPEVMVNVFAEQAASLKHRDGTPFAEEEVLSTLSQHVPQFIAGVRQHMSRRAKP